MLIAHLGTDGDRTLLLGLSRQNVNRLMLGEAIRISAKTHDGAVPEGFQIAIMFGETEKEMMDALKKVAAFTPATKVTIDPRVA